MDHPVTEVIVVGAGQSGLSASFFLKHYGLDHIVFERGKIGESWRSKRWKSFVLNSPNKLNVLAGDHYQGDDPDGFCTAGEFADSLQKYAATFDLPVLEDATILSVTKDASSGLFKVIVSQDNSINTWYSRQIIIASGASNESTVPAFAKRIAPGIQQLHAGQYRAADQLPDGAVLVAGSAQSGCQIAEDLAEAGREVYLSTGMVPRVPRMYRGKDIMDWLLVMGFFNVRKEEITEPAMLNMKAPQMTGRGKTRTISLQALAKKGVTILGKMDNAAGNHLFFQPNAAKHIQFADEFSANVKSMVDGFILQSGLSAPPAGLDEADLPDTDAQCDKKIIWLEAAQRNITTIIWSTGFGADPSYIKLPVFDKDGKPKYTNGISEIEGLYFLGLPWMRSRKSTLIAGAKDDAEFICRKVYEYASVEVAQHSISRVMPAV